MTTKQAERLADYLVGLEDARKDLVKIYTFRMEGSPTTDASLREAGDRWWQAFSDLGDFVDEMDGIDKPKEKVVG